MRRRSAIVFVALSLLFCLQGMAEISVKRGRDEGTMNIPASNVVGNGNITLFGGGYGSYGSIGLRVDPALGLRVGISNIMQIRAQTAFTNFTGLGTSEAHVQLTSPFNDRLRFFGVALAGSLYLLTSVDTIGASATVGKPDYNSFMGISGIIDLDWLALFKKFPLKTYLSVSMADEPTLLFRYDQLALKTGFEWKMYQNSWFADAGAGLYKEKRNGSFRGDSTYAQRIVWFEPGMRYRLYGQFSIIASFRLAVYQDLKPRHPLPTSALRAAATLELPLLFKETNTETIRTLVFMEQIKEKKKDNVTQNIEQGKRVDSGLDKDFKSMNLKSDIPDSEEEKAELRKREEIQKKMDEIEKLLEELQ
jgi:hypothetical protein